MKIKINSPTLLTLALLTVVPLTLLALGAPAVTQYAAGSFVWDNGITAAWSLTTGGARTAVWTSGNDAVLETPTGTVNNSNATVHNLTFTVNSFYITNTTLTLTGPTPTIGVGNKGYSAAIWSVIAGSAGLTVANVGTVTLSGANTYTGPTIITGSARVVPTVAGAFSAGPVTVGNGCQVCATLSSLTNNFTISGTGWVGDSTTVAARLGALRINNGLTISGTVTLAANATIRAYTTANTVGTVSGVIGDSGSGFALDTGSAGATSTLVLSGANTYSGATTISGGSLWLNNPLALQNSTLTMTGLGTLLFSNGVAGNAFTFGGLAATSSGAGYNLALQDNSAAPAAVALTVGNNNASSTYAGALSGTGSLLKTGTGSLTLSGANTYSGNTTISGGTLALTSTGSISNSPAINIASGATFDVSAIAAYNFSSSTTLKASGTALAATISGGTTVNLESLPIILTYDGSHPALSISQGTLSLNGNAFTVNSAPSLATGVYPIIQQASGTIVSSGTYSVNGTAIGTGQTASIQVIGANVNLVVQNTNTAFANANVSTWVFPGASGRLITQPDALGNRIIDHSGVGYQGGLLPLPSSNTVPTMITVVPVAGNNVSNIQSAINFVSSLPLDANGFRGAVLLSNGVFQCASTIYIQASGVVLRGMSSNTNGSGTVLEATATNQYNLIQFAGSSSSSSGTPHTITNLYVPVGAHSFYADDTSGLFVGQEVMVRRVATTNWIHDIGMDLLGPPPIDYPWAASDYMIDMDRVITRIEGNHVFVDAPITCAIDARYANGTIRSISWAGRISNVGIEHLFGKSDYFGSNTNETHGWTFVKFDQTVNGWARDVNSQYFGYSCVSLNSGKFITVQDCQSLDPISIITGARRYAFSMNGVQNCLVKNCYTRADRHQFLTGALTTGPNVFVDGTSDSAYSDAGPHQRWATGILWDSITVHGNNNDIQNAGNAGSGHGWRGANCVIWNNAARGFVVQSPPGANNWLIGSVGPIIEGTGYVGPHAPGNYDSSGSTATNVFPASIYFSQLQDRLAAPNLQTRDYWLGDIDQFTNSVAGGGKVFLDSTWSNAVQSAAFGQPLDGFDVITNSHWIPFTFNFLLATNEHVVAATLSLAMRATISANNNWFYLGSLTNVFGFSNLGWLPVGTGTNTTVRVLDLASQLNLLANGQLNIAAQGDLGIDWAMLELQVAPNTAATNFSLVPVADATVRGGTSSANNFGTATNLTVCQDASANNQQRAYVRWDLSGVAGKISQARVVLTPISVGANGIEQGVAIANSNNWTEAGLTWNNQPGGGERFATWLPSTNGTVSFDVTPQVLDALQNDQQLSLELFSLGTNSVNYASRENANAASRPQLVLSLLGAPLSISPIGNRTMAPNTTTSPISFTIGGSVNEPLTLSGASSNSTLVPNASLIFSGSGTNRTVTITPLTNQTGVAIITVNVTDSSGLTVSGSFTLTVSSHVATQIIWNGPGAGTNNWSTTINWLPAETPEFLDNVKFFDAGAAGVAVSNVNNFLDPNFGGNLASLQFGNTNGNHTTWIAPSTSLNLSGVNGFVVGTETDNGSAQAVFATVTGIGGALNINNGSADLIVRQGSAHNSSQRATLDLSGLGNFNAVLDQILVGVVGPVTGPSGTLYLARTNRIAASGTPGICAADSNSNGGNPSYIYLGIKNEIDANTITIGRSKSSATLKFNPAFASSFPTLFLRGSGADRVAMLAIGDNSQQNVSSNPSSGVVDFSGGTVDALVDTIFVGKGETSYGAGAATGTLTLTDGTLDANTIEVGYQNSSSATAVVSGTVNVNGTATLVVNSTLRLANNVGGSSAPVGTLNITGGTVMSGDESGSGIIAGGGTSTIAINGGTLTMSGAIGAPGAAIGKVALTNATLGFSVASGAVNLVATNLITGTGTNTIMVISLPAIGSVLTQIPLIQYAGTIGGSGYNFVLSNLVPAGGYSGYLSNNTANSSVDLVFVGLPATPPGFSAVKVSGMNVIFTGTNGVPNWTYYVMTSTNLGLPLIYWTMMATNVFDSGGGFQFTNACNAPQQFYRLQLP